MSKKIAIFDYRVTSNNPIGSCHLRMLRELCDRYDFTVFSVEFENPNPHRIRWVRIAAPLRPYAALFAAYHLLAPLYFRWFILRHKYKFDVIQSVESNLSFGDVAYVHFCHRSYLKFHWQQSKPSGLKGKVKWLGHWLPAVAERLLFVESRKFVVPSEGLARELRQEYPDTAKQILVLPNPVDLNHVQCPPSFDRESFRNFLGVRKNELLIVFVAQGHFERKGLPLLLDAFKQMSSSRTKLLIVGGTPDSIAGYRSKVTSLGLDADVVFAGLQKDVRPFLWASDAFTLPSYYEVFPLVALEAAAAGLPLIVTALNGVEEFLCDGVNGLLVDRKAESLANALRWLEQSSPEMRHDMGNKAKELVVRYGVKDFTNAWDRFYASA